MDSFRGSREPDLQTAIVRTLAARLEISLEEANDRLHHVLDDIWAGGLRPRHLRPSVAQSLQMLDRLGIPRAIASDHDPSRKLGAMNLSEGWAYLGDATAVGALKPLPDILEHAVEHMGCHTVELVHVGDREDTDGESARNAGAVFLREPYPGAAPLPVRLRIILGLSIDEV